LTALQTDRVTRSLPLGQARFDIDLPALVNRYNMQWKKYMPSDPNLGVPMGNGDIGALIFQQPRSLSFSLGKSDVWDRTNEGKSFRPGKKFSEIRNAYLNNDHQAMIDLYDADVEDHPLIKPHLTSVGTLVLHLDEGSSANDVDMQVRLSDGTARMTYDTKRIVETIISRKHDVMMIEVDRGIPFDTKHPWGDHFDHAFPPKEIAWEFSRAEIHGNPRMTFEQRGDTFLGRQTFSAGGGYVVGVRFEACQSKEFAALSGRGIGNVFNFDGRVFRAYLAVVSDWESDDPAQDCADRLERAIAAGADQIRQDHQQWWSEYWMRGLVSVADHDIEKAYYRGLYLTGSMLRPGKQSPGLQGVWAPENYPLWWGDYHSNINIQSIYWQLLTNNRLDLMEPYISLYDGIADTARADARDYFEMPGLIYPHAGSIAGHDISNIQGIMFNADISESAWILKLFWDYYRYSLDTDFLRDIAYPLFKDMAAFMEAYLEKNPETGKYDINPSPNFEGGTGEDNPWAQWGKNSQWATFLYRVGFKYTIETAEILGVDEEDRERWQEIYDQLAPFPINEDGLWKEFENKPTNCGRGHNFLLGPVFPGELVSAWHGPEEWRKQAIDTWQAHKDGKLKSGTGGSWCGGQGTNEILRIGDGELAYERSRWSEGSPENFFNILCGGWPGSGIQVDHGPGMARMLADLVMLEAGGVHRLYVGIPEGTPARFHSLRGLGGVLVSSEKRADQVDYILLQPTVATSFQIASPWAQTNVVRCDTGEKLATLSDDVLTLDLSPETGLVVLLPAGGSFDAIERQPFHFEQDQADSQ